MNVGLHPIRFGAFSPEQKERIAEARKEAPSPIDLIFQTHMPEPQQELQFLPQMADPFAQELVKAMGKRFYNAMRGPLDPDTNTRFRNELANIFDRLEKAAFTIPDNVIEAFEKAYKITKAPGERGAHDPW